MHKIVTHQYFLDDMQMIELPIATKYLEFSEVINWQQTREIMLSVLRPYLKKKDTSAQDLFILPTDQVEELTTEISNEDVEWYKKFKENYKKNQA